MMVTIVPLLGDDYIRDLYESRSKRLGAIFGAYVRRFIYLLKSRRFDLLWIEKELFPWLPSLGEILLDRLGIPYIVDYDDAVFHRYDMHPNTFVRSILGHKIDEIMRRAVMVIVGNDYLAERARQAGAKRVEYLPSVIDLDRYHVTPKSNNAVFTIGWIGSPATADYLYLVEPALSKVCKGGKGRLVLVGSGQIELKGIPVEIRPWSEETEVTDIQSCDVGIMPLPDEPWERGKCGYKLIQYMACGLPVVASPVGINKQIIEEGKNGFLAATMAEWVDALKILRDNTELGNKMGKAGRIKVEAEYSVQVTAPRLADLLRSVGG